MRSLIATAIAIAMIANLALLVRARQPFVVKARVSPDASLGAHRRAMAALREAQSQVLDLDESWSADVELGPLAGEYALRFEPVSTEVHPFARMLMSAISFVWGLSLRAVAQVLRLVGRRI